MIPINEQLYPLPDGWQWVTIKDIADVKGGKRLPKGKNLVDYKTRYPYIRVTDFFDNTIKADELKYLEEDVYNSIKRYTISSKDVYISIAGSIGKVGTIPLDLDGANLTENAAKITRLRGVNQSFLMWFLTSDFAQGQIKDLTKSTTQPKLALFRIEKIPIPLPPLDEQQRIVALLDELFADLDEAKTLAQAVVDGSKLRWAAILHKAFTGGLSRLWRDEHGTTLDSWQRRTVASVCKGLVYGTSKKSKSFGKMIVLRMGNLQCGKIDWKDLAYSDDEADIKKYLLSKGDVLFNRTNSAELVGKTSIYREEYPAIYAGYLIKLDYDRGILNGEYLNYVLNSPNAKEYCNRVKTDGVNQSNINARKIGAYVIPLPPPEEQKEIVRLLDDLLSREQRTKDLALKTLERVELMKKSILARAFRGELSINQIIRGRTTH